MEEKLDNIIENKKKFETESKVEEIEIKSTEDVKVENEDVVNTGENKQSKLKSFINSIFSK